MRERVRYLRAVLPVEQAEAVLKEAHAKNIGARRLSCAGGLFSFDPTDSWGVATASATQVVVAAGHTAVEIECTPVVDLQLDIPSFCAHLFPQKKIKIF